MRLITVISILMCSVSSAISPGSVPQTATAQKLPIAVLTIEGKGISEQEADILTERLRSALVQNGRYQVVERSQMEMILEEQGFQQSGCSTNECLVQAGLILGVQQMVSGVVGRIGNSYAIDIRLFDVESTEIIKAISHNYVGEIDGLLGVMPRIAVRLAGGSYSDTNQTGAAPALLTDQQLQSGIEAIGEALNIAGQAIKTSLIYTSDVADTTAKAVKKFLTPKPKDLDIERGRRQGRLDAYSYQRKITWLIMPFIPALASSAAINRDEVIVAGLITGWLAKKIWAMLEGEPTLPPRLIEKISSESIVYQENYRKSWVKKVKSLRSRRGNTGCILGVTTGLLIYANENGGLNLP